jgi:hypothetical protein
VAKTKITFAVAVKRSDEILRTNLLSSPCFEGSQDFQILVQENFISAATAYNDAIERAVNDIVVLCHHDMIFPASWPAQLERALEHVNRQDPAWGVLGCYGETQDYRGQGYIYSPGRGIIGRPFDHPIPVQTLDEIVLILRKSSGLRFDTLLPHFHLYGADICLRATVKAMKSYAISAFCIHNAQQYCILPNEFYQCCRVFKRRWKKFLPVQTTCIRLTRSDIPIHKRRLREHYLRLIPSKAAVKPRMTDIKALLSESDAHRKVYEQSLGLARQSGIVRTCGLGSSNDLPQRHAT